MSWKARASHVCVSGGLRDESKHPQRETRRTSPQNLPLLNLKDRPGNHLFNTF